MIFKNIAIALILLSSAASANNLSAGYDGILSPLPACDVPGPLPVEYYPTTQEWLNSNGGAIASAGRNPKTGRYFIAYDYAAFRTFPLTFQRWILAHECQHHQLKHTERPFQPGNRAKVNQDERAADCAAAKSLANLSKEQWEEITAVMVDSNRIDKFTGFPAHINRKQFGYHNDHKGRVKAVKQCLANIRR